MATSVEFMRLALRTQKCRSKQRASCLLRPIEPSSTIHRPTKTGSTPILRTLSLSPILGQRSVHVEAQALHL